MAENSEAKPQENGWLDIRLDKDMFRRVLDSIDKMLQEDMVLIQADPDGFRIGIAKNQYLKRFPDIPASEVRQVLEFVGHFVHFGVCHEWDVFHGLFKVEDKKKVKRIVDFVRSHKTFGTLAFRVMRNTNYITGSVECHVGEVRFLHENTALVKYYDITMPYIDGKGEETIIRLELDEVEVQLIAARLANIIKKG